MTAFRTIKANPDRYTAHKRKAREWQKANPEKQLAIRRRYLMNKGLKTTVIDPKPTQAQVKARLVEAFRQVHTNPNGRLGKFLDVCCGLEYLRSLNCDRWEPVVPWDQFDLANPTELLLAVSTVNIVPAGTKNDVIPYFRLEPSAEQLWEATKFIRGAVR